MITLQAPQGSVRFVDHGAVFCFPDDSSSVSYWSSDSFGVTVQFKGSPDWYYTYAEVPAHVVSSLITAESVGSFIATKIKGKYEVRKWATGKVSV